MKTMQFAFLSFVVLLCLVPTRGQNSHAIRPEPCACAAFHDPVCGTDGKDYSNKGCAACAGVKPECKGTCPCPPPPDGCVCTLQFEPVCGVDGVTYSNDCFAGCEGVKIECRGKCPCEQQPSCSCDPKPVCGTNGITYLNACRAKKADVPVACDSACPCEPVLPCERISCLAPCSNPSCPDFPKAQCVAGGQCGCSAVYVSNCEIVDCGISPPPSIIPPPPSIIPPPPSIIPPPPSIIPPPPSITPPSCKQRGETCTDSSLRNRGKTDDCCRGLKCCTDCVKTPNDDDNKGAHLIISTPGKKCMSACPKCR